MNCNYNNSSAFSQYLESMVKLDELQKMTEELDKELEDSQRVMSEMKSLYGRIPTAQSDAPNPDISQLLVAGAPKLLMPDMLENTVDVDLDNIIATMKTYAEDLRKNFVLPNVQQQQPNHEINGSMVEEYASSLEQLSKRLMNVKLNKTDDANKKNEELEAKLSQLCEGVNMFTQLVQVKAKLSESNKNWTPTQQDNTALQYDSLINKLVLNINEVTYLLKNKN